MAGRADRLRLGAPCGGRPAQQEGAGRRGGAAALPRADRCDRAPPEGCGRLQEAFAHFRKVTRSYWPGLFRCYDVADLPRTNNDLEQFFGSYRYHERRCQRPEGGLPGDGGAGLGAAGGGGRDAACGRSRWRTWSPPTVQAWRDLRGALERRQAVRTLGRRFRRDPVAYLRSLEESLIKQALPP